MPELFLYLLKVNLALMLLYGLYYFVLRKLTFYSFNRLYLWFSVGFATLYPLLDISELMAQKANFLPALPAGQAYWVTPTFAPAPQNTIDYTQVAVLLFWAGVAFIGFRLLLQFASLFALHRKSVPAQHQGKLYRQVRETISPFSFGQHIYANPAPFSAQELSLVLQHEQVHVRQAHTLDVLLAELLTAFCWLNPVSWKMRQSIKENLEFMADQQLVNTGIDRKFYQYALLRAVSPSSLLIVHPFNTIPLKNRIKMMNQPQSPPAHLFKLLLALPLIGLLLLVSRTESLSEIPANSLLQEIQSPLDQEEKGKNKTALIVTHKDKGTTKFTPPVIINDPTKKQLITSSNKNSINKSAQQGLTPQQQYEAFLKRNPSVKGLGWDKETLTVYLKSGKTEEYPSTPAGTAEVEKKYGSLPVPPPPPPPAPAPASPLPPPPPPYRTDLPAEFLQRNPTVKGMSNDEGTIYIILKSGEVESFDITPAGIATFEKKYGALPPPPKPVRRETPKADLPPPPPPVINSGNKLMPSVVEKDKAATNAQELPQE